MVVGTGQGGIMNPLSGWVDGMSRAGGIAVGVVGDQQEGQGNQKARSGFHSRALGA